MANPLRTVSPKKADIDRAIKAVRDVGLTIHGLEIYPDGGFRVLTNGNGGAAADPDSLEAWRAKRAGRQTARS